MSKILTKSCGKYFAPKIPQIRTQRAAITKISPLATAKCTKMMAMSKNSTIKIFWIKFEPASTRPMRSSAVKN